MDEFNVMEPNTVFGIVGYVLAGGTGLFVWLRVRSSNIKEIRLKQIEADDNSEELDKLKLHCSKLESKLLELEQDKKDEYERLTKEIHELTLENNEYDSKIIILDNTLTFALNTLKTVLGEENQELLEQLNGIIRKLADKDGHFK